MDFYRALYAFFRTLFHRDCEHTRVNLGVDASFCPDCGYKILLVWALVKCRECDAKRVPRKSIDGRVEPMEKFCRHCGSSAYRLIKRETIDAFDLLYSVSLKEIDYSEERRAPHQRPQPFQPEVAGPPRSKNGFDIVEGEVIRKRYVSQNTASAWSEPPFPMPGEDNTTAGEPKKRARWIS